NSCRFKTRPVWLTSHTANEFLARSTPTSVRFILRLPLGVGWFVIQHGSMKPVFRGEVSLLLCSARFKRSFLRYFETMRYKNSKKILNFCELLWLRKVSYYSRHELPARFTP